MKYRLPIFSYTPGDPLPGTFARSSVATYRDAADAIQTAAADVARDGHYVDGVRTLLVEEEKTNWALHPFSSWTHNNVSVGAAVAGPAGAGTGYVILEADATVQHRIYGTNSLPASGSCTLSVFVKSMGTRYVLLRPTSPAALVNFDLVAGTTNIIGTGGPPSDIFMEDWGNGWWRCGFTYPSDGNRVFQIILQNSHSGTGSYPGSSANGIAVFGPQGEAAPKSSYIENTGSSTIRLVDALTIDAGEDALLRTRYYDLNTESWVEADEEVSGEVALTTGRAYSEITLLEQRPVLTIPPDWSRMAARQLDELRIESAGAGIAVPWAAGTAIRRRGEFSLTLDSRAAIAELVAFHAERRGRRKGFWAPTWLGDFRLLASAAAATSELTIEAVGISDLIAAHGEQFRHLALIRIVAQAYSLELHRIESVVSAGETEVITLDGVLAADVDYRQTLVCPLLFARLSQDKLALRYSSDAAARVTIGITELPREYAEARNGDAPIWLYEFSRGAETWRFADWGEDVERAGETWSAASIAHGAIRSNSELLADPVEITASTDDEEHALRLLLARDLRRVAVTIYRADADNTDVLELEFSGELIGRSAQGGGRIAFRAATALAARDTVPYPRTVYDRYDNRHVYDSGVVEATYTTAGTIAAVGSDWIEAPEFGAKATAEGKADWFAYGFVRVGDETRMCRFQDGDRLYLDEGFSGAAVAGAVEASAGYDRSLFTRDGKFGDAAGHRGFAYMPDRNLLFEPLEVQQEVSTRKK